MGQYRHKNLILWCSPGFGMVDMWLPVIRKLKEKNDITIDFVFPESSSLVLEEESSDLFNLSENFADKVIYRSYSKRWFIADTLIEARKNIKSTSANEKILFLSKRLINGRASKYLILKVIGVFLSTVSRYFMYIKENIKSLNSYDISTLNNTDGILYDIIAENKSVNNDLRSEFEDVPKFSMLHGLACRWITDQMSCEKQVKKRSNVTVYSMSNLETSGYKKCYGILEKNIVHAGIPRHDDDWIEYIYSQKHLPKVSVFDSFVLIIGRPASTYNTIERKKKALMDIYDIICIKYKLKLIVKPHPKENIDGIDGDLYKNTLGIENYGEKWIYSHRHPLALGKKALFAISFFSGVVIDMLAIKKLTIEYLNLENLPLYDNDNSLRDEYGKPVFQYRYVKLVLGASNKLDLEQHVESILSKNKDTLLPLYSRYNDYYKISGSASEVIANDIFKKICN